MRIVYRREAEELEKLRDPAKGDFKVTWTLPGDKGNNGGEYREWAEYKQLGVDGFYLYYECTSCDFVEQEKPWIVIISREEKERLLAVVPDDPYNY